MLNADEGVAYGATIMAGILAPNAVQKALIVSDVTPLSLGIKVAGDAMDIVIERNTNIPHSVTKMY